MFFFLLALFLFMVFSLSKIWDLPFFYFNLGFYFSSIRIFTIHLG
ncbi:hypothetical protein C5167_040809 [Papaver somniferum]|uniref:Uncharacterized protein n=1 Tax=Papaver somniferum TaxID=3469 RepID=A0A4Y7IG33_PAPSO|nr:hypothetical protein C5167_040809 [Papaver somniferum]